MNVRTAFAFWVRERWMNCECPKGTVGATRSTTGVGLSLMCRMSWAMEIDTVLWHLCW